MAAVTTPVWSTKTYSSIVTSNNSTALTGFSGLAVNELAGVYVTGTGIATGAYIVSNTATAAVLSAAATASGTITLTADYSLKEAEIANLALARIGADLIKDTTEDTPAARQCRAIFAATRDELVRDYEFNFAIRRLLLSQDTAWTSGQGLWTYVYTVPTSITILKILDIGGNPENLYEVGGSGSTRRLFCNIYTNYASPLTLELRYVEQILDPARWDNLFKDALVLRIASKLAIPLVKRADLAQFLQSEFSAIFSLAKNASSKERVVDESEPLWTDRSSGLSKG